MNAQHRRLTENGCIVVAFGIAVFMLAPPTSPLLGAGTGVEREVVTRARTKTERTTAARPRVSAKGILLTGYSAGGPRLEEFLALLEATELNAVVIDVKDERGEVSWMSDTAAAVGAGRPKIRDPRALVARLRRSGVYVIGRVVTFQDSVLAGARPDIAVQDRRGGLWRNEKGLGWVDPHSTEARNYNLALAREAVDLGFDEVQFDYVRFPSDGATGRAWFRHADGRTRTEVIRSFLADARRTVGVRGAFVSADLFGLVTLARDDLGIGQRLDVIAREVDYVSPMLYPSHYHKPEYDIPDPEREPYRTIALSIRDAKTRIAGTRALLRPWIQDFSLRTRYTAAEVRAQIRALADNGVHEFLLWNAGNEYTAAALRAG